MPSSPQIAAIMTALSTLTLASCVAPSDEHQEASQRVQQPIVRGQEVPADKYPWMVKVPGCTASLISPSFVLSAAHCFAGNRNAQGTLEGVEITTGPALFGHPDLNDAQITRHPVAVVHMHPEYRKLTLDEVWGLEPYDVVLLELETPIALDQYLRLPTRAPTPGEELLAAGWGLSENGPVTHLRETTLRVRDHATCFQGDEKRFCSRGNDDNSNIWSGDSGGPVFVPDDDGFMLLGTNSTSNGDTNNPFASHARIITFVPWILEVAGDEFVCSGDGPETVCEADLNECALGTDDCGPLATCENTVGGFECVCPEGYQSDGQGCADIDECTEGPGCDGDKICINTEGGFECACPEGTRADGQDCVDIDECALGTDDCGPLATCENTVGGFECVCPEGYQSDGQGCADIDECALGTDDCGGGEVCVNAEGGFECDALRAESPEGCATAELNTRRGHLNHPIGWMAWLLIITLILRRRE